MNRMRITATKIGRLLLTLLAVLILGFPTLMTISAAEPGDPDTTVKVTEHASFTCGETGTSQILVSIANDPAEPRLAHGVEVHLSFDPTKIQVVDADPDESGVQIAPEGGLVPLEGQVVVQEVDNVAGTILFAVSHKAGVQETTDAAIANITWEAAFDCATMTEEVCSEVSVVEALMSDPDGYAITVDTMLPGIVCIPTGGHITGSVKVTEQTSFGCGETDTSQILVSIANNQTGPRLVHGVEVHLSFDPTKLQVVDADPGGPGVQIAPEAGLFPLDEQIVVQEVDNTAGTILFAVSWLYGGGVQEATDAAIATITWEAAFDCATVTEEVCSEVSVVDALMSDVDGYPITVDETLSGTVCVLPPLDGCITGSAHLQGRDDHSGVTVTAGEASPSVTSDGKFEVCGLTPDSYEVQAEMYGYLDSVASNVVVVAGETTNIDGTKLLGGNVAPQPEPDNVIDIGDITYIAYRFLKDDMNADVNGDGVVNIFDLTMVAANFGRIGPTLWSMTP